MAGADRYNRHPAAIDGTPCPHVTPSPVRMDVPAGHGVRPTMELWFRTGSSCPLILQPGLLTLTELGFDAMRERGQPPPIMGGCVD